MKIAVFNSHPHDQLYLAPELSKRRFQTQFYESHLNASTVALAQGFDAVCVFVNDQLDRRVLESLAEYGIRLIALRCAGFNNVDLPAASALGIDVVRVPEYSPHAVAEHTFGLILCLNRKIHKAYNRVRESNFALDGLLGFDLYGKTLGIIGTGQIGACVARIGRGFGCQVLMNDPDENVALREVGRYCSADELLSCSDIITLHCPLNASTKHFIRSESLERVKPGAMLINTSRGGLVDTRTVIQALKSGHLGALGLDVYEEEAELFFEDHSQTILQDDIFARLVTFPNVLITSHQAFFTREALAEIAKITADSLTAAEQNTELLYAIRA